MQDTYAFISFFKIIFYLIVFFIVIFLVYFFTKIIAKKTSNLTRSNKIRVIDFLSLSTNSKIVIIEILNNIYILAINSNQISVIDKLIKEDIEFSNFISIKEDKNFNFHFEDIIKNTKRFKNKFSNNNLKQSRNRTDKTNDIPFKGSENDKE